MTGPKVSKPGVPWLRWVAVLIPPALLLAFPPSGLTAKQDHLLAVFVATIVALVAQPVPMGVSCVVAMTVLALTRTVPPVQVLSGFANVTVWLIFTAFLFSRAFTQTGLGKRIGYLFIRRFARTPLSLGYSLAAADLVLAPFIPSDTARGGGVIYPIARSVALDFGSEPGGPTRSTGAFLILVCVLLIDFEDVIGGLFDIGKSGKQLLEIERPPSRV